MKKDFSPEEKLLRLIRNAGKKQPPREDEEPKKPEAKKQEEPKREMPRPPKPDIPEQSTPKMQPQAPGPELPDVKPELPKAAPLKAQPEPRTAPAGMPKAISISMPFKMKGLNIKALNAFLIVVLAGLILYFVYDIVYTVFYKKAEIRVVVDDVVVTTVPVAVDAIGAKSYSYYSSSISGRNIFKPQQVEVAPVITGPSTDEIKAGLSLIGIIAGARPQAIIEEKKTGKSHFLYIGGTIGESKVVEVMDDSVVLEYKGQRFELVL